MLKNSCKIIAALAASMLAVTAAQAQSSDEPSALEVQDLRLGAISDRIMIANADLCRTRMPTTGLILHSFDQYREGAAQARFTNGPVAIGSIVTGSAGDLSGLRRDDAIVAINGTAVPGAPLEEDGHLREAAFALLAAQDPVQPVRLQIVRDGEPLELSLRARPGCRSLVEIRTGSAPKAQSDGRVIQVSYDFATQIEDEELAVVFAHELAHTVLEHRRRKEDAGIDVGLLGQFGTNQRANREAEVEADRLTVHLLANAGYDPRIASRFWREGSGRQLRGGVLGSWVHPSPGARADLLDQEIDLFLSLERGPTWPGHLLEMRDRNFTAD